MRLGKYLNGRILQIIWLAMKEAMKRLGSILPHKQTIMVSKTRSFVVVAGSMNPLLIVNMCQADSDVLRGLALPYNAAVLQSMSVSAVLQSDSFPCMICAMVCDFKGDNSDCRVS